jgi:hypothetical protein
MAGLTPVIVKNKNNNKARMLNSIFYLDPNYFPPQTDPAKLIIGLPTEFPYSVHEPS